MPRSGLKLKTTKKAPGATVQKKAAKKLKVPSTAKVQKKKLKRLPEPELRLKAPKVPELEMFTPHEFLRQVAQGNMTYADEVLLRGKSTKIKRTPTFKERLYAASQAAPYFAPKLAINANTNTNRNAGLDPAPYEDTSDEDLEAILSQRLRGEE